MKILFAILLLLVNGVAYGEEPITGAFGFKLGEVWDGESTFTYESGAYISHHFDPEFPDDFYKGHGVRVTPVTGIIYAIRAQNAYAPDDEWGAQCGSVVLNRMEQEVSKKYGPPTFSSVLFVDISHNSPAMAHLWTQYKDGKPFREIRVDCLKGSISWAYVSYIDLFIEASITFEDGGAPYCDYDCRIERDKRRIREGN